MSNYSFLNSIDKREMNPLPVKFASFPFRKSNAASIHSNLTCYGISFGRENEIINFGMR